jgi:hypothetical protein
MLWAAITTNGKFTLVFLDDEKLTAKKYRDKVLAKHVKDARDTHINHQPWIFQ